MRALSIRQPWAWLIVNGYKRVENRTWATNVRGPIAIHAGVSVDYRGYDWVQLHFPDIAMPRLADMPRGGVVGTANLVECDADIDDPWFFGPYGFVLADAKPCDLVPCRGALGFFSLPAPGGDGKGEG